MFFYRNHSRFYILLCSNFENFKEPVDPDSGQISDKTGEMPNNLAFQSIPSSAESLMSFGNILNV